MQTDKLISADSHIVEPPDLYTSRIDHRFRDRAPRMERMETPTGRKYDSWFLDGQQVGTLGAVMQAGQSDEKGPDARRRPKTAGEAYFLYVEPAVEGANEADGPLSSL